MTDQNHQDNIISLPVQGLWYVLDEHLRPRPVPNQPGLGFPSMDAMSEAFEFRWGYQSLIGDVIISSTFLALNHGSRFSESRGLKVFEIALMSDDGVKIVGRYSDVETCVEAHHEIVDEMLQLKAASND